MWPTTLIATVLIAATSVTGRPGWHLDGLYPLATEQLDTIVSPNAQSSHMHRIFGTFRALRFAASARVSSRPLVFHLDRFFRFQGGIQL